MLDLETLARIRETLAELEQTRILLYQATMQAKASALDPDFPRRDYLRTTIGQANAHHEVLTGKVKRLTDLAQQMLNQRQSAKVAFSQGWDARLADLLDQLPGAEYADLRRALEAIRQSKR